MLSSNFFLYSTIIAYNNNRLHDFLTLKSYIDQIIHHSFQSFKYAIYTIEIYLIPTPSFFEMEKMILSSHSVEKKFII